MAQTAIELAVHRKSTAAFIAADESIITLTPRNYTMVAGTKTAIDVSDRSPQSFKIIWAYDNGIGRFIGDLRGGVRRFDFILLGNWDAVVAIGDHWNVGNQRFEIEYVFPQNGYEVKAGGVSHGPKPT